ncbi:MAG: hypothetical protein ACP5F6_08685 [Microbacter sp.]
MKLNTEKRHLLIVAALVWMMAGLILFWRGVVYFQLIKGWPIALIGSVIGGLLFFKGLFVRISSKHIVRIVEMETERPNVFQFFNLKSYILMFFMILLGISIRKSGLFPLYDLSFFYFFMGIPLFLSSLRFIRAWLIAFVDVEINEDEKKQGFSH